MTVQLTIIGLGQVGTSVGMALEKHKKSIKRIGNDKKYEVARAANARGALDEIRVNLPSAVREAGIVLLCTPFSEIRETLELIGPDLAEGAVVMDMAPVKEQVAGWAGQFLPAGRFYVGLVPGINPDALSAPGTGPESARADLFERGVMMVTVPAGTPSEVVDLALDFAGLLGAKPMLADMAEADGLMTSAQLLPQLASAALLNATVDKPGWMEIRKLAGQAYAITTGGVGDADSLQAAALSNRENVVRVLDGYIEALRDLRDGIDQADEKTLLQQLDRASEGRERWLMERTSAEWLKEGREQAGEFPSFGERVQHLFVGGAAAERMKARNKKK
jgi:prephenate dehydrogenase